MKWMQGIAATVLVCAAAVAGCASGNAAARPATVAPAPRPTPMRAAPAHPRGERLTPSPAQPVRGQCLDPAAGAVARENARPGSTAWLAQARSLVAQGYASATSVVCGSSVRLFVDTSAPRYRVQAWRLGYYRGAGARLIWTSPPVPGHRQPPARRDPDTNTVRAGWAASLTLTVSHQWPAGQYLLRIVPSTAPTRGGDIPLTVRDPQVPRAATLLVPTATYQAYNPWGGYSAYDGPGATPAAAAAHRSRVVTFDRPYAGRGDGQLLRNDYPLLRWLEYKGIDTAYVTTEDVDAGAAELDHTAVVVSGTHSEYISAAVRAHLQEFTARGGNLAFFGANQVYWRPRYAPTATGPRGDLVIYRYATEDPQGRSAALSSVRWRDAPIRSAETGLLGSMYDCLGAHLDQPLVVADHRNWLFAGTGLSDGDRLPHFVVGEIDRAWAHDPAQGPVVVLNRTLFPCPTRGGISWHDVVVRATGGGGAVFNAGTFGWVCHLGGSCADDPGNRRMQRLVDQMTSNVLRPMLAGPAAALASGAAVPIDPVAAGLETHPAVGTGDATLARLPLPAPGRPGPPGTPRAGTGSVMVPSPVIGTDDD